VPGEGVRTPAPRCTAWAPAQAEELAPGEPTAAGTRTQAQAHACCSGDVHAGRCRQGQAGCYLAGCAVGDTGFSITAQVEVGGTSTLVPPPWREEAEVAAAGIAGLAGMVGNWGEQGENCESEQAGGPSGRHVNPPAARPSSPHNPLPHPLPSLASLGTSCPAWLPPRGQGPPSCWAPAPGSPSGWR